MGNPFNKQPAPTNENSNWCDSFDDYANPNLPNAFCSEKKMTDSKFRSNKNSPSVKRLGPKDYSKEGYKTKEICALIITINENDSYDALYQTIEQTPPDPTKFVSVYQFSYGALLALYQLHFEYKTPSFEDSCLEAIQNPRGTSSSTPPSSPDIIEVLKEVKEEMNKLDGENIVINFECCGSCSDAGFCEPFSSQVLSITKSFLQRNYVVMFSDFSLKALIKEWNYFDANLGSNPFYKVGEFGTKHVLRFNSQDLIDCDFAQLQNVGELCEKGRAEIQAPGGTILYSVKKEFFTKNVNEKNQKEDSLFDLKVLTVNEEAGGFYYRDSEHSIPIIDKEGKEVRGLAGHVVLNYKNGGKILASCGHWVELIKLDVTKEGLLAHAEKNYGMEYANNLREEIDSYSCEEDRMEKIRFTANSEVQKKAPCRYK